LSGRQLNGVDLNGPGLGTPAAVSPQGEGLGPPIHSTWFVRCVKMVQLRSVVEWPHRRPGPTGGKNVHRSMRRFTRIVIVGAIAAFAAVPLFATSASAVEAGAAVCTFDVLPNPVPAGGTVHIEGTAPAGATVTAFDVTNPGTPILVSSAIANASGNFRGPDFVITPPRNFSATFTLAGSDYATGCADPDGLLVVRVEVLAAAVQRQALAFTGSNNTTSFVLIGVTALIVGIVLTVGARRRSRVSS
jgi:LPXTG-motif cell wall-anchored protein